MRLIAQVVGDLDLHRALHQPLGQLGQQPAGAGDLLLGARAGQQLVDHLIADPSVFGHPKRSMHPTPVRRTPDRIINQTLRGAHSGRAAPRASSSRSCSNTVLLFNVLVLDGMTISFVHAYTLPGTDPFRRACS